MEKELFAIVTALEQWRKLVLPHHVTVICDNYNLTYLFNLKNPAPKIVRWKIRLSEFSFTTQAIEGFNNNLADYLSRDVAEFISKQLAKDPKDRLKHTLAATIQSTKLPSCICGQILVLGAVDSFYEEGHAFCDDCKTDLYADAKIYHCLDKENISHPNGYDLCTFCAFNQDPSQRKYYTRKKKKDTINVQLQQQLNLFKDEIRKELQRHPIPEPQINSPQPSTHSQDDLKHGKQEKDYRPTPTPNPPSQDESKDDEKIKCSNELE